LGDVFIDGKHGILVKNNYYEFVNAILWMENHTKKAIEMGKNWGNFVRKERSWKAVSNHWKEFLF
jgi:glycosyltransferase involved in cell wall biosynthesis